MGEVSRRDIEYHVVTDLAARFKINQARIRPDSFLKKDLGIEAGAPKFLQVFLTLEGRFDLESRPQDVLDRLYHNGNDPRVSDVVDYIQERLRGE